MMTEQLTLADAERAWHIARLERSLAEWRASGRDIYLPGHYQRYCTVLNGLKAGADYQIINVNEDLQHLFARWLHESAMAYDKTWRTQQKQRKRGTP